MGPNHEHLMLCGKKSLPVRVTRQGVIIKTKGMGIGAQPPLCNRRLSFGGSSFVSGTSTFLMAGRRPLPLWKKSPALKICNEVGLDPIGVEDQLTAFDQL